MEFSVRIAQEMKSGVNKKYGIALSGGGGRGGFQAGALYALMRKGITPDSISCISVGSLNGIMAATGQ